MIVENNILIALPAKFIVYSTKPFTGQHFSRHRMKHRTVQHFSVSHQFTKHITKHFNLLKTLPQAVFSTLSNVNFSTKKFCFK
jgi:hypothetical protein